MIHSSQVYLESQNRLIGSQEHKPIDNTQNFQDNLWRSQQVNQTNSQTISELMSVLKNNARANFENYNAHVFDEVSLDEWHQTFLELEQTHLEQFKDGMSYLTDSIQMRQMGLLGVLQLNGTNLDTMEWDAIGAKSIVESELKARGFNNVSESQYQESLKTLSKLLNQVLDKEFAKDSQSSLTNALLVLRAELELTPEKWDKIQTQTKESLQQPLSELFNANANLEEIEKKLTQINNTSSYAVGVSVLAPLDKMAALLYEHLSPNEQQEMFDALSQVNSYIHKSTSTMISTNDSGTQLKIQSAAFYNDLVSRFSAIDNTEMLLNLFGDSSLHDSNESKSYESLIDRIRSKLKTTDDSILQKLMNGKTANQAKVAEASAS